eukprot:TRINITY_DN48727_c0_g1_i1.p2 TRINITY_DN48727_c0_g1~~TRINITY_DN48727_c0_g1_i1.p2  ORF type:complete len:113 (-),score=21.04 TRINITY_DN48727_c0_g1_i1:75-413(-)
MELVDKVTCQWVPIIANGAVHVIMYYYYYRATLGLPSAWKKYLTTLQIVQFVADITVILPWPYYILVGKRDCSGTWRAYIGGDMILLSFLILFLGFYEKKYTAPVKGEKKQS